MNKLRIREGVATARPIYTCTFSVMTSTKVDVERGRLTALGIEGVKDVTETIAGANACRVRVSQGSHLLDEAEILGVKPIILSSKETVHSHHACGGRIMVKSCWPCKHQTGRSQRCSQETSSREHGEKDVEEEVCVQVKHSLYKGNACRTGQYKPTRETGETLASSPGVPKDARGSSPSRGWWRAPP